MKTIRQIADEIGVSKQAVHYRIKRPPLSNTLQSLTTKVDGVLTINFDGEKLIKQAFSKTTVKAFDDKKPSNTVKELSKENISFDSEKLAKQTFSKNTTKIFDDKELSKEITSFDGEIIKLLQDNVALLQEQLRIKDGQLAAAQEALKAEQLLHADTKKMLLLPSPSVNAPEPDSPIGFWGRFFKRKKR